MPYYYVHLYYVSKVTRQSQECGYYDMDEKSVRKMIAEPYMNGEEFMLVGRRIDPYYIEVINIFETEESIEEMAKKPMYIGIDHVLDEINKHKIGKHVTSRFIKSLPPAQKGITRKRKKAELMDEREKLLELNIDLTTSAAFLGLDTNWSSATCALQLQEVAVTLVAKRKNIKLDKANVERILNKRIQDLSFNEQYEAFSKQVKASFNVEMPILTTHLRKMRTNVLHEGYNPKPEETDSIVSFTIGLLKKLEAISQAN